MDDLIEAFSTKKVENAKQIYIIFGYFWFFLACSSRSLKFRKSENCYPNVLRIICHLSKWSQIFQNYISEKGDTLIIAKHFDLENDYDKVFITDGNAIQAMYTGRLAEFVHLVDTNHFSVTIESDGSVGMTGFELNWECKNLEGYPFIIF